MRSSDPDIAGLWAALAGSPTAVDGRSTVIARLGTDAQRWFGGWATTIDVPSEVVDLSDLVGHHLDALVLSPDGGGLPRCRLEQLTSSARALGAVVVGLVDGHPAIPWAGQADVELPVSGAPPAEGTPVRAVPPVDIRRLQPHAPNPGGERWLVSPTIPDHRASWHGALEVLWRDTTAIPVTLEVPVNAENAGRLPPTVELRRVAEPLATVADYLGVLDHASFHPDPYTHAERLAALACRATPVRAIGPIPPPNLIGTQLWQALVRPDIDWQDPTQRELHGVTLRRAALRDHSMGARWRELARAVGIPERTLPSVSVLAATNRPQQIDHLVRQIERQRYPHREAVLVLHGSGFPLGLEARLRSRFSTDVEVVRVPDTACLGDALNVGTQAASGDLIVKWDDDDWYGDEHVWDMVLAAQVSGAHLVGKAAEFVYLEELDLLTRRYLQGGESYCTPGPNGAVSRKLAGGTLTIGRSDLLGIGGWRRVRRAVDQRLLDTVLAEGGVLYRTHGFGYVLNCRTGGHTWDVDVDYFLRLAIDQWRGLRLDLADAGPRGTERSEGPGPGPLDKVRNSRLAVEAFR